MHLTGTALIILGGVMEGLFSLPVKLTPRWSWENIWGLGSLAALVLVPVPLLLFTVPEFSSVYASAPTRTICLVALFGLGWGFGGIFFGLGVAELGLSLGTSSIMGLIAIGGSIVPLIMRSQGELIGRSNVALMLGIVVMLAGLAVCSRAGRLKFARNNEVKISGEKRSFWRGIFYCVIAGLLSALVNFALIFGDPITQAAKNQGVSSAAATSAIWAIVFAANYLVNVVYCAYLMRRRGTFWKFSIPATGRYWLLAIAMGLLWAGGIVIYGIGAAMEGSYGPFFAFPMMLIVSILTANVVGVFLGEWRGAAKGAKHTMQLGVMVMMVAIVVLGYANWWSQ